MREELDLDQVPGLPQAAFLGELAPALWKRPGVLALWLEGSLGRGNADRYSDVDLYVGVEPAMLDKWRALDLEQLFGDRYAAHAFSTFGPELFVYHVYLSAGGIYDLHVQPRTRVLPKVQRLLLACRDDSYGSELLVATPDPASDPESLFAPPPVDPTLLSSLLVGFWINIDKSRKVLYRKQDFTVHTGLYIFRQILARLLFMEETGADCGDLTRTTIHGLKAAATVLGQAHGADLGRLLGAPATTYREVCQANEQLHREVARVGRVLAARHQVAYPAALEEIVLTNWQTFLHEGTLG